MASNRALVTIIVKDNSTENSVNNNIKTNDTLKIQDNLITDGNLKLDSINNNDTATRSYPLPEPTAYSGTTTTLVDGGTSVSGHLLGSTVRSDVAQISLSWNYLEAQTWAQINQLFKDRYINTVLFYDQTKGDWDSREMYISDRSAGLWRRDENGDVLGWTGCSLQLTEV